MTMIALGVEFARLRQRTLLIDMEGQGCLADGFGIAALSLDRVLLEILDGSLSLH